MERETAMKILKELHDNSLFSNRIALETLIPELADSNDERIRKALLEMVHDTTGDELWVDYNVHKEEALAWLEKQGESYTKKDVDDAYLKGICDAKHELEKQGNNTSTIIWHSINEKPEEMKELFCEWESDDAIWHDVAFYDEESHTFRHAKMPINVTKWVYVDELLEKQGEQKPILDFKASNFYVSKVDGKIHDMTYNPADKVEPKFKVGDYIVSDYCMGRIVEITNDAYLLDTGQGIPFSCSNTRLWDVTKDAKDGDILACGDKVTDCPFIFHNLTKELNPRSYCGVNMLQHFQDNDENGGFWCHSDEVRPATKEQRDLLFQKMKEAGFEWNAKKKELKKIEQKSAWSEEDEEMTDDVIKGCVSAEKAHHFIHTPKDVADWLKSLKDRIICKNTI